MNSKEADLRAKCALYREKILQFKHRIEEMKPAFTLKQASKHKANTAVGVAPLSISLSHRKKFINYEQDADLPKKPRGSTLL